MPLAMARKLAFISNYAACVRSVSEPCASPRPRECPVFRVPSVPPYIEHAWYKAYAFVEPARLRSGWDRDRIVAEINTRGVPCSMGSCSEVYLEKAFDGTGLRPAERLPVARELGETSVMFLVHPTLTEADIGKTCEVMREVGRAALA